MNLRQIEAFRAIMQYGSMTVAAKELHTSQPNVSRLIAQLERDAGLVLFERSGTRLVPTAEGDAFYREVERAFVGLKSLTYAAENIRNLGSGRLRIAAVPAVGLAFLPAVIGLYRQSRPGVTVSLHVNTSTTVEQWVASQYCDLGVVVYVGETANCDVEPLPDAGAVCVLPEDHRLAGRRAVNAKDLSGESFISLCHGDGTRTQVDRAFELAGIERKLGIEAQYGAICCEMVRHGLGVTLVHPLIARSHAGEGLRVKPFRPTILHPTFLLFPPHRPRTRLTDEFVGLLRAQFDVGLRESEAQWSAR
ncbi:LysR family transcriptional regulator [Burkholderia sp. WAC0059]|uniref:LysR substrate-binding domain-containing protein n=1 Tax=Burkholderia sp. WAC0059 TaxID=2066022 RepID=UPI000C7F04CA|nr:LysR substrate-binding domain-containing protein [Burkholderia sp. WAC0059]PLZ03153.1 LysR family transcriptional regulator [Burkholderia sp. WAC0059]